MAHVTTVGIDIAQNWELLHAFTAHTKKLPPRPDRRATVRLGKIFGLGQDVTTNQGEG